MESGAEKQPLNDLIEKRWSPRAFEETPLPPALVDSLLEAARWAPSCFNEQPWRFIVASRGDRGDHAQLVSCLVAANQSWASRAPLLILTMAQTTFSHNGKPNRHAWHDVGLAAANLTYQAGFLGLFAHQMAGILTDQIKTLFSLPENIEPVTAIAIGYLGKASDLPEALAERETAPRTRKPASELFFKDHWGNAF